MEKSFQQGYFLGKNISSGPVISFHYQNSRLPSKIERKHDDNQDLPTVSELWRISTLKNIKIMTCRDFKRFIIMLCKVNLSLTAEQFIVFANSFLI